SDHHALLPTEQKVDVSVLSDNEKALWELIIIRFLETLSADYEYRTTTVEVEVLGEKFLTRLTVPVKQGWKDVARDAGRRRAAVVVDEEDGNLSILSLKEGSELEIKDVTLKRGATLAPDRYTEADLLFAMEHAGRLVEDVELKKRLENGLGTPATRADIIEKLIQNNCMERKDKYLVPTAKGRELVRLVPPQLKSAELTGKWEQRLFAISSGAEKEAPFIEDIKKNSSDLVNEVIANREKFDPNLMGDKERLCPSCHWPMMTVIDEYDRPHHVCQRFSCGYEEMEVKKKVEIPTAETIPTHASASPVKKVLVSTSTTPDGKKKIVLHKSGVKAAVAKAQPQVKWETTIEVVKPSHYRPRQEMRPIDRPFEKNQKQQKPDFKKTDFKKADNHRTSSYSPRPSSDGGTFADFLRASEERKKKDEEKRKRK
ncbi:MAG: DNA topoisomerase III, partial [Sphaerochaetaceae bacterium]|nr:DNA topoisomerase III [Sphaerochaetaceae bacterium]